MLRFHVFDRERLNEFVRDADGGPVPGHNPLHVLVIEDAPSLRQYVSVILRGAGFVVSEASDGHDAHARALSSLVDIAVAGVSLAAEPGLDVVCAWESPWCRGRDHLGLVTRWASRAMPWGRIPREAVHWR